MTKLFFLICLLISLAGCKRGNYQVIELKNSSSENIYFLISGSRTPTINEVYNIRPATGKPRVKIEYSDKEQEKTNKHNLYRNLIERDSLELLLSSEGAEFIGNAITIQSIIKNRYDGQVHIFIITEDDLLRHSDQIIIDKKLYKYFKSLTAEDIKGDKLTLEYF